MENENRNNVPEEIFEEEIVSESVVKRDYLIPASILISSIILASAWVYTTGLKAGTQQKANIASNQQWAHDLKTTNLQFNYLYKIKYRK